MKLYLEKRGCDFWNDDTEARQESDLENYRLFLEFIDKDGKRICGDVHRGAIRAFGEYKNGKPVILSNNGLYTDFQYENHTGCYCYHTDIRCAGQYTKETVLEVVNRFSAVAYDEVEIVSKLPAAAYEYPESVLALERAYLAGEHAAMVQEIEQRIRDSFSIWMLGQQWSFHKMTAEEYKSCTLIAFQLMVDKYGIVSETPEKPTPAFSVARRMVKHFFEDQKIVDPYADEEFLIKLENLSPLHVRKYLPGMSLEEFSSRIVKK